MDKLKLNELLDSVYELEGLIHLALSRDDNPAMLGNLIARKGELVASLSSAFSGDEPIAPVANPVGIISVEEEEEVPEPEEQGMPQPEEEAAPQPEEKNDESIGDYMEQTVEHAVEEPIAETPKETIPVIESEEPVEEEEEEVAPPVISITPEITVQEPAPAPRGRLVFTLNDRFRFKRELFANSDVNFNAALAHVAELDSYEEAEDYFLGELNFDPSRDEVTEFLEILKKYYK